MNQSIILTNLYHSFKNGRIVISDLTHAIDSNIPTWDGCCGFNSIATLNYGDDLFCTQNISLLGSSGTHMDAPLHLYPRHTDISELHLNDLFAPLCILNVSSKAAANPCYRISMNDINDYQNQYGEIPDGAVLIANTGWSHHWKDPQKYRNCNSSNVMQFPSFSVDAGNYLINSLKGIGIDTLSPDGGDISYGFPIHELFLSQGKYILENITNLDNLPPIGAYIISMPMKIHAATESPTRVLAFHEVP